MSFRSSTYSPDYCCPTVGSAANSALSHDEARQLFQKTQQRWSQTNDQLTSAIKERTTSPLSPIDLRQKDQEIGKLRQELLTLQAEMGQCQQQLQFAEATIRQQQATIKNQSKAIENPRPLKDTPPTPRHHNQSHNDHLSLQNHVQQPVLRSVYGPVAPPHTNAVFRSYGTNGNDFGPGRFAMQTPDPEISRHSMRTNDFGSPEQYNHVTGGRPFQSGAKDLGEKILQNWHGNPMDHTWQSNPFAISNQSIYGSRPGSSPASFASPKSFQSNPYPETSIPQHFGQLITNKANVQVAFQRVFDLTQEYAVKHANVINKSADYGMPQDLKDRLLNAASKTTAFGLMSDRSTRYLLVMKVISQWMIKHILKFNTFSGLDPKIDEVINGAKATIYQSTPAQLRFYLLTNVANEIKKIRARPDFAAYIEYLSKQRANQLLPIVRPMMHQQTGKEWEDLVALLQEAYKLAGTMFASTDEFSFEHPAVGQRFDPEAMVNIDPQLYGFDTLDLVRSKATVRLGTTPLIRMRKNVAEGEVHTQVVLKARVLLRRLG